jgi:hypothetical protein
MGSCYFPPALTQATEVPMAQANYFTSPVRAPITDLRVKASTNPATQSFVRVPTRGNVS